MSREEIVSGGEDNLTEKKKTIVLQGDIAVRGEETPTTLRGKIYTKKDFCLTDKEILKAKEIDPTGAIPLNEYGWLYAIYEKR